MTILISNVSNVPDQSRILNFHALNQIFDVSDESLSIESPMHSEDFASTELNFEDESPRKSESFTMTVNDNATKTEAIVNRELILSAKTDAVERVVIPEKTSGCCCIL